MSINLFKNFRTKLQIYLTNIYLSLITKLSLKEMKSSNKPRLTKRILKWVNQKNAYRKYIRANNLHSKEIYHL